MLFTGTLFLLVSSDDFRDDDVTSVKSLIEDEGGETIVKKEYENEKNLLNSGDDGESNSPIGHIICTKTNFVEYTLAKSSMIPVTTPLWVHVCKEKRKYCNPKNYNPDPKYFMRDVFICVADNLSQEDKELIYGGVSAFGGQYLDDLTRYTTHLIAIDMKNDKSIIAASANNDQNETRNESIDIKIVSPEWIDDCLKFGRILNEGPYLVLNPTSESDQPRDLNILKSNEEPSWTSSRPEFMKNKCFYISDDYPISDRMRTTLIDMIIDKGGKVSETFNEKKIDIYIGKYRNGKAFVRSAKSKRIITANVQWLYSVLAFDIWVLPKNSNLLHYPIPREPLPEFRNLKISITNYSGDARLYLTKLITVLGGSYTKTLSGENDVLIASKPFGKKYEAAKFKWREKKSLDIKIVNSLWIEECFAYWKLMDFNKPQYTYLGRDGKGVEGLLCRTKLKETVLDKWLSDSLEDSGEVTRESQERPNKTTHDAFSINEQENNMAQTEEYINDKETTTEANGEKRGDGKEMNTELTDSNGLHTNNSSPRESAPSSFTSNDKEEWSTRAGRSAKFKAVNKLHQDIHDLNDYQAMSKSSRKMKEYMRVLENETKKAEQNSGSSDDKRKAPSNPDAPKNKKRKVEETRPYDVKGIVTGCEGILTLSKQDLSSLKDIGIRIIQDVTHASDLDTIIAPKILRTAKFLKALSKAKRIVHPNFLIDILRAKKNSTDYESELLNNFPINKYSLDKIISNEVIMQDIYSTDKRNIASLSEILQSSNKGKVFANVKLNISPNLVGGSKLITDILEFHGLKHAKVVKSITSSNVNSLLASDNSKTVLVVNKEKDMKLVNSFKKLVSNGVSIEWDWCVKSIFAMELRNYENFSV
ncbi:Piso0_001921 [Millerozyma farinosa CBS 7064]|uniref:Piso0_001921 protein n=1 Tax=Pichia sorbitophila (strain ATCC MYA-4447 / BCRC 22081 / CBS 7064 / NBRC 10061 / NRRL Y-12695) TaxID=559304 RepID=G8YB77_PICSO|nr:Piso0_001921 [Millerozyma farinosa CBS 7064]